MDIRTGIIQAANALGIDPLALPQRLAMKPPGRLIQQPPGLRLGLANTVGLYSLVSLKQNSMVWTGMIQSALSLARMVLLRVTFGPVA